jgi:hypothetical protein
VQKHWVPNIVALVILTEQAAIAEPCAVTATEMGSTCRRDDATRREGVYLRLTSGVGFSLVKTSKIDVDTSALGGAIGVALGGSIASRLVAYGELSAQYAPTATRKRHDGTTSDIDLTQATLGAGMAYYVASGVYVAGALTAALVYGENDDGGGIVSGLGVGVSGTLGKEWRVSPSWALGVASQLHVIRAGEEDANYHHTLAGATLMMSATH